ncbi:MAG: phosphate ABC transporter substrate-binding protein [Chthoniobacteraceae bacterium]
MKRISTLTLAAFAAAGLLMTGCDKKSGGDGAKKTTIADIGSDTMVNLAASWADAYRKVDKDVSVEVGGGGSGTGVTALIEGTAQIANCSRTFEEKEIADFKRKHPGGEPKQHMVGYDAMSIFVHKGNPLNEISVEQLGEIYKADGKITKWSQLGVTLPAGKDDIACVTRQNNSGTVHYFKEVVVGKQNEYRLGAVVANGSNDVAKIIGQTVNAIGFSGMAYATPEVKVLRVSKKPGEPAVAPSIESALDKSYPISRPLFMYTAGEAGGEVKKYIDWILSDAGQQIEKENGYVPLPKK